jgi:hypothetical protein
MTSATRAGPGAVCDATAPSAAFSCHACTPSRFLAYGCCDLQVTHGLQPQDVCTSHIAAGSCRHSHCIPGLPFVPGSTLLIHEPLRHPFRQITVHSLPFISSFRSYLRARRYISATSRVVIASEKTTSAAGGETVLRKVALKFMKNGDQFSREKESREFFKDMDDYVVGIYNAFTKDNKVYEDALDNACVPSHSPPLLIRQTSQISLLLSCCCPPLTVSAVIFMTSKIIPSYLSCHLRIVI